MHRAREEMNTLWTLWRLHYGMPITDPRVQNATEEDVLEDMLIHHFREQQREAPETAASLRQTVERMGGMNQVAQYLDTLRDRLAEKAKQIPAVRTPSAATVAGNDLSRLDPGSRRAGRKGPVKP